MADRLNPPARRAAHDDEGPLGGQRPAARPGRPTSGDVENKVVPPPAPGEILLGVVDDLIGSDRADQVRVPRTADPGDGRAERPGDLHGERANAARCPVDQDLLAGLDPASVAQAHQGGDGRHRHGGRLLEGQRSWLAGQQVLGDGDVLAETAARYQREHLVAGTELSHVPADRLHLPGHVATQDAELRAAQPQRAGYQPRDVGLASHDVPVVGIDRGGTYPDQDLVVPGHRLVDVREVQVVR